MKIRYTNIIQNRIADSNIDQQTENNEIYNYQNITVLPCPR